jgi:glycosyltransferase involved in cell wall biosynthesis
MYPSKQKAYAGIFVKNQYEQLRDSLSHMDSIEIFYMKRQFSSSLGSVIKYFKTFLLFIPFLFKKFDIIHLHFFHPLIYLVWIYKKIHPNCKSVVTFHGIDITKKINNRNKIHFQKVSKCVDFSIPVGATLAQMVEEKLKLKQGKTLPVGVNNRVFKHYKSIKKYDFIFVGSFTKTKGIDVIIEAILKLNDKSIKYCFCGSGEYYSNLKELNGMGFNVSIYQSQTQPEISELLNQSRFFLIMSRNEGFPTVSIESMFCGVPVLTSDIPQFKEQVEIGVNGYMIPANNVDELVQTLVKSKNIPDYEYEKLVSGALNSFRELSLQNVCDNLIVIYRQIINNKETTDSFF